MVASNINCEFKKYHNPLLKFLYLNNIKFLAHCFGHIWTCILLRLGLGPLKGPHKFPSSETS